MNVATGRQTTPGYPTRRQFLKRNLAGVAAAIGLTAAAGQGNDVRVDGDLAVEPRGGRPVSARPFATLGEMRAEPRAPTNFPAAVTNQVVPFSTTSNCPACTVQSDRIRLPGGLPLPAEPVKGDKP